MPPIAPDLCCAARGLRLILYSTIMLPAWHDSRCVTEARPHMEGAAMAVALHLDPSSGSVMTTEECTKAHPTHLEVWGCCCIYATTSGGYD